MKLRLVSSILIFLSSYFPLAIIFIIKDLDSSIYYAQHPVAAAVIAIGSLFACIVVLVTAAAIRSGLEVTMIRVANKSGDMFTYTIPYMISFYNFNLGDWKTLASLPVFMVLMFALAYRTQNMFINPVLALAGYGLYDCQFKDGGKELQGLLIAKAVPRPGDKFLVERLSYFFVLRYEAGTREEDGHDG